jgi:hypothetical protein
MDEIKSSDIGICMIKIKKALEGLDLEDGFLVLISILVAVTNQTSIPDYYLSRAISILQSRLNKNQNDGKDH